MRTEFPIHHIDFTLFAGDTELACCDQSMMLLEEFRSHEAALESLRRMVADLAAKLNIADRVTSWSGAIEYLGTDSWCYHCNSFYTWRYFSEPAAAMADLLSWVIENNLTDVIDTEMSTWKLCTCEVCKSLQRTVILYSGEKSCGSY